MSDIKEKLAKLGYKLHFWYENGKLDAVVIAKWEGEDLVFKQKFSPEKIAELVLESYLKKD